jgi:hypothetical protein
MSKLYDLIAEQQKDHETEPRFMIGEQLKEIAEREPLSAELLERDLEIEEMNLAAAEKHFQQYADKKHGKAKSFCITPVVAEKLLREFYGLSKPEDVVPTKAEPEAAAGYIDLSSFL